MRVKATEQFKHYRNASLKLDKKDFRKLQAGKEVDIPKSKYDEYPHIYTQVKGAEEVKNGS